MEIMTTWNSEFEFDLQRFVSPAGPYALTDILEDVEPTSSAQDLNVSDGDATVFTIGTADTGYTKIGTISTTTLTLVDTAFGGTVGTGASGTLIVGASGWTGTITSSLGATKVLTIADLATSATSSLTLENTNSAKIGAVTSGDRVVTDLVGNLKLVAGTATINSVGKLENNAAADPGQVLVSEGNGFEIVDGKFTASAGSTLIKGIAAIGSSGTAVNNIKTGSEAGAVVDVDAGVIKLLSGSFVSADIDLTVGAIAVAPATSSTVTYEGLSFANADSATGSITAANGVTVSGGIASKASGTALDITCGVLYSTNAAAVAKFKQSDSSVTNFTTGEIAISNVNGLFKQDGTTADLTFTGATATVLGGTTLAIKTGTFARGTVEGATGKDITIGTTTFANADSTGTLKLGYAATATDTEKAGVDTGKVLLSSTGTSKMYGAAAGAVVDTVSVSSGNVNVEFNKSAAGAGKAYVTGLEKGEVFTLKTSTAKEYTYTAINDSVVHIVGTDGTDKFYTGYSTATFSTLSFDGGLTETNGSDIKLSTLPSTGTTYYDEMGFALSSSTGAVVEVNRTSNTVSVTGSFQNHIYLNDSAATVTDKLGTTKFALDSGASLTVSSKNFAVDAEGVVSSTGTGSTVNILTNTGAKTLTVKGTVNVDQTSAAAAVVYKAGTSVEGAKITLNSGEVITLTEANNASDATDTTVATTGNITGLDGDATVVTTGVTNGKTIATAGNGTFTLNKVAYVVAGDDNGVTFFVDSANTTADNVDKVTELDRDATITMSSKLSDFDFTVNTTAFKKVNAKSGAAFTATDAAGAATVTLFTKGDTVCDGTYTYVVESMGGSNDGIVVGANKLAALNDGDKIRVYNNNTGTVAGTEAYMEYAVSGNVMVVTDYTKGGKQDFNGTTTYTLSDSSDTGFTVGAAYTGGTINGDKGTSTETVTFGTTGTTQNATSLTDGIYVNADGTTGTSETKAVAKVGLSDDVVTYTSMSTKGQVVNVTAGKDNWQVTTGAGKDTIGYAGDGDVTIDGAAGNDEITLAGKGDKNVSTGDGKNEVHIDGAGDLTLTLGSGNDTVDVTAATNTGDVVINANGGNNKIDLSTKTSGDVTIVGGSGKDTITASGKDNVVSGGGGADSFNITAKDVTISDYTFGEDVLVIGAATVTPGMLSAEGKVVAGGTADISANAGDYYAATLVDATGKNEKHVAWAKEGGSNIDTTSYSKDVIVKGDADGTNTLYTGAGDDVIYSYADNDSVFGGAGKDVINLLGGTGHVVGISTASSKDTVTSFKAGFSDSDSIYMVDGDISGVKSTLESVSGSTGKFTFKNGSSSLTMSSVSVSSVTGAAEVLVGSTKLAALATCTTAKVDSAKYADIYMGDKSAVDFSATEEDLFVDLSNGLAGSSDGAKYVGINTVMGGTGNSTLMGTASADYIVAAGGKTSLYGGAGKDTLVGSKSSADIFFFGDGTNTNTITNFTNQGEDDADKLQVIGSVAGAKLNGSNVEISSADGSKAIISGQNANSKISIASDNFTGVAKVGSASSANNFTYDKDVTYYGGGSASDKISLSSGFSDNAQIWLDGSQSVSYGSIDVVDMSNGSGNYVVAGDSSKQTIVGGKGDSSLWGGIGATADSLKGGAGTNVFFYGSGEGNDTISSSNANDSINLYNIKLSDVKTGEITNAGVSVEFNDGNKLTVATSKDITFKLASGEYYVENHSTKGWDQA